MMSESICGLVVTFLKFSCDKSPYRFDWEARKSPILIKLGMACLLESTSDSSTSRSGFLDWVRKMAVWFRSVPALVYMWPNRRSCAKQNKAATCFLHWSDHRRTVGKVMAYWRYSLSLRSILDDLPPGAAPSAKTMRSGRRCAMKTRLKPLPACASHLTSRTHCYPHWWNKLWSLIPQLPELLEPVGKNQVTSLGSCSPLGDRQPFTTFGGRTLPELRACLSLLCWWIRNGKDGITLRSETTVQEVKLLLAVVDS